MLTKQRIIAGLGVILIGFLFWNMEASERYSAPGDARTVLSRMLGQAELPPLELMSHPIMLPNGSVVEFQLAEPFQVSIAAEGLGKARFMAMSPDGRLFVPDLVDYLLSHEGKLYILEDFDEETKQFRTKHTYLENLRGPNSVAFYTDENGNDWLYLALTAHLVRYPYRAGDTEPSGEPEIIVEFPNTQSEEATSVVWHITRTILFHDDKLYVAIGSGCDSCEQFESEMRGMIVRMDPDGSNTEVYADGLRNSVGLAWAGDALFATTNGVDHLGPSAPDERMYRIKEDAHYGWPYCYELGGMLYPVNSQVWERAIPCEEVPRSFSAFEPRSAPLGLRYFEQAHPTLENSFLVALHGSFAPELRSGYRVVRVSGDGEQETFMSGFQDVSGERFGRPVDFLPYDEKSFFMTDDWSGRVYFVYAE